MPMRFFRDDYGIARCEGPAATEVAGQFFESDIQSFEQWADEVISQIDAIKSGRQKNWSRTGNAYNLELTGDSATIECLWDESVPICRLTLGEFRDMAVGWSLFINASK